MGSVICGNPSKALRQRRQGGPGSKDEIKKGLSRLMQKVMQKGAVFSHSEGAEDEPIKAESELNSIIEELQSWKLDHDKRMKEILKTKEAQILVVDHDEALDVLTSDEDEDEDYDMSPRQASVSRPSSGHQRHMVDLRLKRKTGDIAAASLEETNISKSQRKPPVQSKTRSSIDSTSHRPRSGLSKDILNDSWDSNDSNDSDELKNRLLATKFDKQSSGGQGDSMKPTLSISSSGVRPGSSQRKLPTPSFHTQNGDGPDSLSAVPYSSAEHQRRPGSRGSTVGDLAPLRAPSPTSAQIINSMRARQKTQSPPTSPRPRKLRVGPTGLPLSSQSQQPVIRGGILPPSSRGGAAGGGGSLGTPSSRSGVALLPSQPRIARQLPETPNLVPRPPKQS
ncbi:hypothetical protein EGW08_022346 [Elysia chlorotica]|uniref:Uncharacterized protein n=1 Tax=Elysia chlorotica TaxID=188477 RepID=A0A433SL80_ELYCH|nr:hypothetical protein EGW08_022346 [Elysia chlorotica]